MGVEDADTDADVAWAAKKIAHMRILKDDLGKMNHSILDVHGSILSISQFTVYANVKRETAQVLLKRDRLNMPKNCGNNSMPHSRRVWH